MKTSSLIFFFLTICLVSCNFGDLDFDNVKGPVLTGNAALPIGHASYTMRQLIEDVQDSALDIREDSGAVIALYYFDTLNFSSENLVEINDVRNTGTINLPQTPPSGNAQTITVDTTLVFSYPAKDHEILQTLYYSGGNVAFSIVSRVSSDIQYNISLNTTTEIATESALSFTGTLQGAESQSNNSGLSGYKTDLITQGDSNVFEMAVSLNVLLNAGDSIAEDQKLDISLVYTDQTFELIYGQMGQDTINAETEVVKIDFFDKLGPSGLKFKDPKIQFNFENTYGLPLGILFGQIYGADSTSQGVTNTYLSGNVTNQPQVINASETPGEPVESVITLNSQNSSLQDLLASTPNNLIFDFLAIANPIDAAGSNFVMDTSGIRARIQVSLPLEVSMKNVARELPFDLGSGLSFDGAETVTARLVTENGLPFSGQLGLDIRDSLDVVLHTVPVTVVLEAPFMNSDGFVLEKRKHISDIELGAAGVEALRNGSKMVLTVILNTPGNQATRDIYVKVLADYGIDVQVSLAGKLNAQL